MQRPDGFKLDKDWCESRDYILARAARDERLKGNLLCRTGRQSETQISSCTHARTYIYVYLRWRCCAIWKKERKKKNLDGIKLMTTTTTTPVDISREQTRAKLNTVKIKNVSAHRRDGKTALYALSTNRRRYCARARLTMSFHPPRRIPFSRPPGHFSLIVLITSSRRGNGSF